MSGKKTAFWAALEGVEREREEWRDRARENADVASELAQRLDRVIPLREAAEQAERAIDGHLKFLLVSGLAEEGGGLPLYEASKGLAEARASLAAALAGNPSVEDGL